MISAQELRIGNLIEDGEVEGIHLQEQMIEVVKNKVRKFVRMQSAESISLTPEILEKCGFQKINENYFISLDERHEIWFLPEENKFEILSQRDAVNGDSLEVKLESLHQLQNLYYALTGEELEIKL